VIKKIEQNILLTIFVEFILYNLFKNIYLGVKKSLKREGLRELKRRSEDFCLSFSFSLFLIFLRLEESLVSVIAVLDFFMIQPSQVSHFHCSSHIASFIFCLLNSNLCFEIFKSVKLNFSYLG